MAPPLGKVRSKKHLPFRNGIPAGANMRNSAKTLRAKISTLTRLQQHRRSSLLFASLASVASALHGLPVPT